MLDRKRLASCAVAFGFATAVPAGAQDGEETLDPTPVSCISMGRVRTTTVVNDRQILFYERSGRVYLNNLERNCVGLKRSGLFTYKIQSGARFARLCHTDSITVLETSVGGRGFNCGLSRFTPITEEQANVLLTGPDPVDVETVELPDDAAEDADTDQQPSE